MKGRTRKQTNPIHFLCCIILVLLSILGILFCLLNNGVNKTNTASKGTEKQSVQVILDADYNSKNEMFGMKEKDICINLTKELGASLEEKGIVVAYTNLNNENNKQLKLSERKEYIKKYHSSLVLSIKTPFISKKSGVKFYGYIKEKETFTYAKKIDQKVQETMSWQRAGIFDADIYEQEILKDLQSSALVIEAGCLGDTKDRKNLSDPTLRFELVAQIAEGINEVLATTKEE